MKGVAIAFLATSASALCLLVGLAAVTATVVAVITGTPAESTRAVSQGLSTGTDTTGPVVGADDVVSVRGIQVHASIAGPVEDLLAAAEVDGVSLGGWGWRSPDDQVRLRREHCGPSPYDVWAKPASQCDPPTARPGQSLHERGLAIDFTCNGQSLTTGSGCFEWLQANAARFGLFNLPSEPWHWSTTGH